MYHSGLIRYHLYGTNEGTVGKLLKGMFVGGFFFYRFAGAGYIMPKYLKYENVKKKIYKKTCFWKLNGFLLFFSFFIFFS